MVVLVTLPARLDESNAAEISAVLAAAAGDRPDVLIADMSRTESCDWAGARALAAAFSQATTCGTELRLVTAREAVRRVISLNGLDRFLPIYEDVTAASRQTSRRPDHTPRVMSRRAVTCDAASRAGPGLPAEESRR